MRGALLILRLRGGRILRLRRILRGCGRHGGRLHCRGLRILHGLLILRLRRGRILRLRRVLRRRRRRGLLNCRGLLVHLHDRLRRRLGRVLGRSRAVTDDLARGGITGAEAFFQTAVFLLFAAKLLFQISQTIGIAAAARRLVIVIVVTRRGFLPSVLFGAQIAQTRKLLFLAAHCLHLLVFLTNAVSLLTANRLDTLFLQFALERAESLLVFS